MEPRQTHKARSTGTTVELWDNRVIELDDEEVGRWWLICNEHAGCCAFKTLAEARSFASQPEEWCPGCQDKEPW